MMDGTGTAGRSLDAFGIGFGSFDQVFEGFVGSVGSHRNNIRRSAYDKNIPDIEFFIPAALYTGGVESRPSEMVSATLGLVKLDIPDTYSPPGESLLLPVTIANAEELEICQADIRLAYDPALLVSSGISETALTAGYEWVGRVITPGVVQAVISTTVGETLHGSGALFELLFEVTGPEGITSTLAFYPTGTQVYDCDDPLTPIFLDLTDTGVLTVRAAYRRGDLDGDGLVSRADSELALQMAVGKIEPTAAQMAAASEDFPVYSGLRPP